VPVRLRSGQLRRLLLPTAQGLCTDADLGTVGADCAGGPEAPACTNALSVIDTTCAQCLQPFTVPFSLRTGLWACVAADVTQPCRRQLGCAASCTQTSCSQCADASEDQCFTLVTNPGGSCSVATTGATACARDRLEPGQLCSQFSYSDFGAWFRAVGDHYCGNGP
jgi:hypothetical protein